MTIARFLNLRVSFPEKAEVVALKHNILHAAYFGDLEEVKNSIREYPDAVHLKHDVSGSTALHLAAGYGYYDVVEYLATCQGIDFHVLDNKGRTPFNRAAMLGHMGIMDLLWDAMWSEGSRVPKILGPEPK